MKLNHEGEYICECENWEEPVLYPVQELIRCRECKHYDEEHEVCCVYLSYRLAKNEDDFCSDAERKEE